MSYLEGARVLVTGAAGSIGSQICRQLVEKKVEAITLLSLTESGLYNINRKLRAMKNAPEIIPILGSVVDRGVANDAVFEQDVVIHAAAHKHVPLCQDNPIEAIRNNVLGTQVLLDAATDHDVGRFVFVSTDKAVKPTSVMGMTKRVAEMIIEKKSQLQFVRSSLLVTRFGNVLDSDGSVLPLWREQVAAGGPLTLTDKRCERYFMSIPEASELVLSVAAMEEYRCGTFVFDMGKPKKMIDIAESIIVNSGIPCEIKFTGLRPGEKLTEELHHGGALEKTSHTKIFRIVSEYDPTSLTHLPELLDAVMCRNERRAVQLLEEITA